MTKFSAVSQHTHTQSNWLISSSICRTGKQNADGRIVRESSNVTFNGSIATGAQLCDQYTNKWTVTRMDESHHRPTADTTWLSQSNHKPNSIPKGTDKRIVSLQFHPISLSNARIQWNENKLHKFPCNNNNNNNYSNDFPFTSVSPVYCNYRNINRFRI